MLQDINVDKFEDKVINSNNLVLVKFYTPWCRPCKVVSPIIEKFAKINEDKITCYQCDIDTNYTLARQFEIMAVPTILVFRSGRIVRSILGVNNMDRLEQIIFGNIQC